jgi:hypothetical protein
MSHTVLYISTKHTHAHAHMRTHTHTHTHTVSVPATPAVASSSGPMKRAVVNIMPRSDLIAAAGKRAAPCEGSEVSKRVKYASAAGKRVAPCEGSEVSK